MSGIKLYYYPMGGRAATARLMLAYAKVDYDDVRIPGEQMESEMAAHPDRFPMQTVPVLETPEGLVLSQSNAINYYVARRTGLLPSDERQRIATDEIVFQIIDTLDAVFATMGKPDLETERAKWVAESFKPSVKRIHDLLVATSSESGPFAFGGQPSMVDFIIAPVMSYLVHSGQIDHVPKDVLDGVPRVASVISAVFSLPAVQEFKSKHPQL